MFDERAAIQLRMQQIAHERERLQDEYKELFTRLREIDQHDGVQPSESVKQNTVASKKKALEWENIDLGDQAEEDMVTKERMELAKVIVKEVRSELRNSKSKSLIDYALCWNELRLNVRLV